MRPPDQAADTTRGSGGRIPWHQSLRALRETRGVTQEGWAARLGVSRKTVQRWESGERAPDPGAESAILNYCREAGLLRAFNHGPLAGQHLTEEGLRDLFAEARWRGSTAPPAEPPPVSEPDFNEPPVNLPAALTSFVGREQEIAAVRRLRAGTRLLTLTGPGGCGKTRLVLALAEGLLPEYADGVWFVDLASSTDPALVPEVVASALRIRATGRQPLAEALTGVLRARRLLIVLDNCEHLLAASAELVETLLCACRGLDIVTTSREPLGIAGETIWRVPPMTVPADARGAAVETADSVQLFLERARLQRPEFALSGEDARTVAEICRRLDGMPLAVELAAARVSVLSVRQIAERLQDRFRLLTNGCRTALPRQRTLRAAMDWSYDLLTAPERALLRSLAVFAGGFTLAAAEAVHAGSEDRPSADREGETLDLLTRLVDKSLVVTRDREGLVRYGMLETVRQYAEEKLIEAGEWHVMRRRHAAWCLDLAEGAEAELFGPHEVTSLGRLEQEHDNLRAALAWTLSQGTCERVTALRLAGALPRFWELRGHLDEGRGWLSRVLAPDAPAGWRAKALSGAGSLAYMQGEFAAARTLFAQSLRLYHGIGDGHGIAEAQGNLGRTAIRQGAYATARSLLAKSLAGYTHLGHRHGTANLEFSLGIVALRQGGYREAEAHFRASLEMSRQIGNREGIANALEELTTVLDEQGVAGEQRRLLSESLALYRELGDRSGIAAVLGHLGMQAWAGGEQDRALALLQEGLVLYRQVGDRRGIARLLGNQSLVALYRNDYGRAATLCRESLALYLEAGDSWAIGRYLPVLAATIFQHGEAERAARLFGAAAALREQLGATLPPVARAGYDLTLVALRAELGEAAFAAAWADGEAMPPAAAVRE